MSILVLMSGGIDSTVLAEMAIRQDDASCLFIDWGQPSMDQEILSARQWCCRNDVDLIIKSIQLDSSGMSKSLSGPCYVPVRNLSFVSVAANVAASRDIEFIWYGAVKDDENDYVDCTEGWLNAVNRVLDMEGVSLAAPFISLTKPEVVRVGVECGLDMRLTFSCYHPKDGKHCDACNSCKSRNKALNGDVNEQ